MIITCNNCNKKFDIDSSLIPDKGRLLQCVSCDHKWFFKKEVLENTVIPIDEDINIDSINVFDQNSSSTNEEERVSDVANDEVEVDLEEENKEKIDINIDESTQVNNKPKKQKNFKILNILKFFCFFSLVFSCGLSSILISIFFLVSSSKSTSTSS